MVAMNEPGLLAGGAQVESAFLAKLSSTKFAVGCSV